MSHGIGNEGETASGKRLSPRRRFAMTDPFSSPGVPCGNPKRNLGNMSRCCRGQNKVFFPYSRNVNRGYWRSISPPDPSRHTRAATVPDPFLTTIRRIPTADAEREIGSEGSNGKVPVSRVFQGTSASVTGPRAFAGRHAPRYFLKKRGCHTRAPPKSIPPVGAQ